MIKKFSKKTKKELGHYVYVYSDPNTDKPFYIGECENDRVFEHLSDTSESEKVAYIQKLKEKGLEPKIDILVHGLDSTTAFKVEAAAIDLIGLKNLTNIQHGHEHDIYGRKSVDDIEKKYNCATLKNNDFNDVTMLFKIGKYYKNGMAEDELFDIVRGFWKIGLKRAQKAKYALAIVDGQVIEAYEIYRWVKAGKEPINRKIEEKDKNKWQFEGKLANNKIRNKYINKSVVPLFNGSRSRDFVYVEPK